MQVYTWLADVTPLLEPEIYEKYYNELPMWRKEKADALRPPLSKAQSVGAWILRMRMEHEFGEGVFNLSHSGTYALCAYVREGKIGCDLEMISRGERIAGHEGFYERVFRAKEREYLDESKPLSERSRRLVRLWTLKESFVKATGEGLKRELTSFEIGFEHNEAKLVTLPEEIQGNFYYKEYETPDGEGFIAVCSSEREFDTLRVLTL